MHFPAIGKQPSVTSTTVRAPQSALKTAKAKAVNKNVSFNPAATATDGNKNNSTKNLLSMRKCTPGLALKQLAQNILDEEEDDHNKAADIAVAPKRVSKVPSYMAPTEGSARRAGVKRDE